MTPEERQMLTDLANKVAQTPAPPIDKEAEDFIRTRIGARPDALYLMTQTVLIQNMALDQARQQIQQLQQLQQSPSQAPANQGSSSFLGGRSPAPAAPQQTSAAPPPTYQIAPAAGASSSAGGSSFLRGAAQTAAGVAAGALAFEGVRSLFGGLGHMGGFGGPGYGSGFFGGGGVSGYGGPVEETVVNNYYDSPDAQDRDDSDQGVSDADDTQDLDTSQDYDDTSDSDSDDFSGDDGSGGDFLA